MSLEGALSQTQAVSPMSSEGAPSQARAVPPMSSEGAPSQAQAVPPVSSEGEPSQAQAIPPNLPHAPHAPLQHPLPVVAPIGMHNVPVPAGQSGHLLYVMHGTDGLLSL